MNALPRHVARDGRTDASDPRSIGAATESERAFRSGNALQADSPGRQFPFRKPTERAAGDLHAQTGIANPSEPLQVAQVHECITQTSRSATRSSAFASRTVPRCTAPRASSAPPGYFEHFISGAS